MNYEAEVSIKRMGEKAEANVAFDPRKTEITQARYQRLARFYDLMEVLPEQMYSAWRAYLWSLVKGPNVLEVGVGTGKNIPYYPKGMQVTAVDLTPGMLARASRRAEELGLKVDLLLADAQHLQFPDNTFDTIVATFVFEPCIGIERTEALG